MESSLSEELEKAYVTNDPSLRFAGWTVTNPLASNRTVPESKLSAASAKGLDEILVEARRGIPQSQNDLGVMYMTGNGIKKDPLRAAHWFLLAARQGEPFALANFGRCNMEGIGVAKSTSHALFLLAGACLMGVESASHYVINAVDFNELFRLAEQGNAQAQYFLGICYLIGSKVEQSTERGFELLTRAIEQNEPLALLFWGRCLANGIGTERDLLRAEYVLIFRYITKGVHTVDTLRVISLPHVHNH